MGKGVIKVSKEAVATSSSGIRLCADNFEIKDIDFNVKSNINAVQTAKSIYSGVCGSITKTREILQVNAGHIEQMGDEFVAVDEKLTHLFVK